MPPSIQKLHKPLPLGASVSEYVHWSLNEMGAVVVVEDDLNLPMPRIATGLQVLGGKLKLFRPDKPLPYTLAPPPWSDPANGAPGNPAGRTYSMGWGY